MYLDKILSMILFIAIFLYSAVCISWYGVSTMMYYMSLLYLNLKKTVALLPTATQVSDTGPIWFSCYNFELCKIHAQVILGKKKVLLTRSQVFLSAKRWYLYVPLHAHDQIPKGSKNSLSIVIVYTFCVPEPLMFVYALIVLSTQDGL